MKLVLEGKTPGGSPSTLIAWYSVCDSSDNASIEVLREGIVPADEGFVMVEESDLKQWRDAGHVAREPLKGIKERLSQVKLGTRLLTQQSGSSAGTVERLLFLLLFL